MNILNTTIEINSVNDVIIEIKQCISISNITKIKCVKSCDEQITLSMKKMFVGENNAIKMTKRFNEVHPI